MSNVYVCDYITQKKLSLSNIFNFMNISSSFVWFVSNNYHIKDYFYNTNRKNITRYINNHNINVQNILRVNRHLRICMGQKLVAVFYIKNCTVNLKLKTLFFLFYILVQPRLNRIQESLCVCVASFSLWTRKRFAYAKKRCWTYRAVYNYGSLALGSKFNSVDLD